MNIINMTKVGSNKTLLNCDANKSSAANNNVIEAFSELERSVYASLETYSNVHRGSGHNSLVSTFLFEQARDIVLEYLGLKKDKYVVIFGTPRSASILISQLEPNSYQCLSSRDIGLPIGVRALAVKRKSLPAGIPFQTGGGTTRLISTDWVLWAGSPDKFEAGSPAIVNIIAFAKALQLVRKYGKDIFSGFSPNNLSAGDILYKDELKDYSGTELLDKLRQTHIGRNILVPTRKGSRPYINLDNAASTPTFTPVWNAVCQTWRQPAKVQQEVVNEARSICAEVLGAPLSSYDVIFTSNTTEAINLAAESIKIEHDQEVEPVVVNTILEHSSNDLPWRTLPGFSLIRLPINDEGFIDLKELEMLLNTYNLETLYGKKRIRLVAVSGASNVLGVYNKLVEISRIVHQYGARLLVDGAQLVAHREVDMEKTGIDYLAFSSHKVYAPFGSGALVVKKGLLKFSSHEMEIIRASGEENAAGIAALGKALVLLQRVGMKVIRAEEQALTAGALQGMAKIPGIRIFGIKDPDSPEFSNKGGVIVFEMKGVIASKLAQELSERGGIGTRYGCHCAHVLIKHILGVGPKLEKFQWLLLSLLPKVRLPGVARVSFGIENSEEDIDKLIKVLNEIAGNSKGFDETGKVSIPNGKSALTRQEVRKLNNEFTRNSSLKVFTRL
jgi:selenocysteine lyase/cysteine desulfurase